MRTACLTTMVVLALCVALVNAADAQQSKVSYRIVDTGQDRCYSDSSQIPFPKPGQPFHGQDAQYQGSRPRYKDNGDGTVTDLVTGLMWSKAVDRKKVSLIEAKKIAGTMTLGGHADWRVPGIKELYSLIDFNGYTGFGRGGNTRSGAPANAVPFINTDVFDFEYGNVNGGERYIDAQWLSATKYVSTTMNGSETLFGVNFADGRIKGYGYGRRRGGPGQKKFYARYTRGAVYGKSAFVDNGDGTITDRATGLMWMKTDSGKGMNWRSALQYAENLNYAGYSDWRLPNAKELHSILDYSRSPDTTGSAAIDPIFGITSIVNEAGQKDYPYFWTSTTHRDGPTPASHAAYFAFGRALGKMHNTIMDVHGAGAQRSDPKTGQSTTTWHGPQGDARRVDNYARCVRAGQVEVATASPESARPVDGAGTPAGSSPSTATRGRFIQRLDTDRDGKVSLSEFDGPPNHFRIFDRNNDGFLSADEAPKRPPAGRRAPLRQALQR